MSRPVVYSRDYDHGCHCQDCRDEMARYQRHRVYAAEQGRPFSTDPTGTIRRVRALGRVGWRALDIANESGVSDATIRRLMVGQPAAVVRKTRDGVTVAYDALWNTAGPSTRSRSEATRKHWAPPLAWSADTIDDPTAKPDYGRPVHQLHDPVIDRIAVERFLAGDDVKLTAAERVFALHKMYAAGTPWPVMMTRMRRSGSELRRMLALAVA